jgi:hypothetical protein
MPVTENHQRTSHPGSLCSPSPSPNSERGPDLSGPALLPVSTTPHLESDFVVGLDIRTYVQYNRLIRIPINQSSFIGVRHASPGFQPTSIFKHSVSPRLFNCNTASADSLGGSSFIGGVHGSSIDSMRSERTRPNDQSLPCTVLFDPLYSKIKCLFRLPMAGLASCCQIARPQPPPNFQKH